MTGVRTRLLGGNNLEFQPDSLSKFVFVLIRMRSTFILPVLKEKLSQRKKKHTYIHTRYYEYKETD